MSYSATVLLDKRLPIHFLVAKRFPKAQMVRVKRMERGSIYDQFTVLEVDAYVAKWWRPVLLGTVFIQVERKEEIVNDDLTHVTHSYRTVSVSEKPYSG